MAETTPMMQQYERIKSQHNDAILFFRLGDFYEMFRQDAVDASRILSLTLTQRGGTPMCGIPHHAARTYIPRLLQAGRKVAICDQTSEPQPGKGIVDRQVTQIMTPGTLLDEEYLDQTSHNFLLSVAAMPVSQTRSEQSPELSLSLFDMSTGDLFLQTSPVDNGESMLETLVAKWQPRELIIQDSLLRTHDGLSKALRDHPGMLVNRFADWQYDIKSAEAQLCKLIGVLSLKSFGIEPLDSRLQSLSAILGYCEHTAKHQLDHIRSIRLLNQQDSLELDETAVKNLELVRNLQDGTRSFSLLEVLDQSRTPMGARQLRLWTLQPLRLKAPIEKRLDAVDWLYHHQSELNQLREELRSIVDVQRLANRIALDKAHPKDLVALAVALRRMLLVQAKIRQALASNDAPTGLLADLFSGIDSLQVEAAGARILETLQDEPSILLTDGEIIREGHHGQVDAYRRLKTNSQEILDAYVNEEKTATGISGLKLRQNNIIGFYLEVTKSNVSAVPSHFIRKQSLVNGERYTTARLAEIEEAMTHASDLCVQLEKQLFLDLRHELKPVLCEFHAISEAIAILDVLCSLAWVATAKGYTRPRIVDDHRLFIRGGRHPVVEHFVGQGLFIPNDLELCTAQRSASTALITGPNMAGKSTFLRQTALIALMAHVGSFVPAEEVELGLVDRIFCRIGASDNLTRGESTFLVEMNETALILRSATVDSLVIMDEVGRGTSTQDGLSIARAILEFLLQQSACRCLFATHFHELTEVDSPAMVNLSMAVEENDGTITFLKKVQPGPSSNSYGIHVARLAGIPDSVIYRAQEILEVLQAIPRDPVVGNQVPQGPSTDSVDLQVPLFSLRDELECVIRNFNLDRSTPLDALNAIAAWKKLVGN